MKQHVIHVKLKQGEISVTPDPLHMTTLDEVAWKVQDAGRLRIEFDRGSPFEDKVLDHARATGPNRPRDEAGGGRFKYTVVEEENPDNRLDPLIIVDPPPTQGN